MTTAGPFWTRMPRDVVQVSGPDASAYLQGQVSQDLQPMAVGDRRWTLLLQPAGRIDVLARVQRTADDVFVFDIDAGWGEALAARLNRFKIRVKVDVESLPWAFIAVRSNDDGAAFGTDDVVGPDPAPPGGMRAGSIDELEAFRIDAGWPAMGAEIVPGETIPAETGITLAAVDFKKGCYPGQELVERMDSRGADAPRRLRILDVPAGAAAGDPLQLDGKQVGVLTSVLGTRALGYVKRGVELGRPTPPR